MSSDFKGGVRTRSGLETNPHYRGKYANKTYKVKKRNRNGSYRTVTYKAPTSGARKRLVYLGRYDFTSPNGLSKAKITRKELKGTYTNKKGLTKKKYRYVSTRKSKQKSGAVNAYFQAMQEARKYNQQSFKYDKKTYYRQYATKKLKDGTIKISKLVVYARKRPTSRNRIN